MKDFILRVYMKGRILYKRVVNLYRLGFFINYLYKNDIFSKGEPELILRVIQEFVWCAFREYDGSKKVLGRTVSQSTMLLIALIDKWFEDKSVKTLDQIMEVLRNELIEREKNGRKW